VANPQSEDGHTRIANTLLEAILKHAWTGHQELKVVFYVARETYGWSRTKAQISYGMITRATGIHRRNAIRICASLQARGILMMQGTGDRYAHIMGIQKNYELWDVQQPVDNLVACGPLPSGLQTTRWGGVQTTSKASPSGLQTTRSSGLQTTPSKQKAIRLKQSENKQDRLKNKTVEKAKISRLIAGNEACLSNCDPRPVIRILQKAGFDVLRVWGAVMQCKRSRITNPAGYLVKLMADPKYMPPDCLLDMGKQEMLRWEQREKSALAGSVAERSVVAGAELVGALAEKFNART
jgi:phage replication O-like protein O